MTVRRGTPDYGVPGYALANKAVDPGLSAEFSALGLSRIDSGGRPFLFDNFSEGTAGWLETLSGAGAAITANINDTYASAAAAVLLAGTSAGLEASISKSLAFLPSNKIGLECAVKKAAATSEFDIKMNRKGGATSYAATLFFDQAAATWKIYVLGGAAVSLSITGAAVWTVAKLIVDFSTGKYVAAIIGNAGAVPTRIDLSANSMEVTAVTTPFFLRYSCFGSGAAGQQALVGYSLLTVDEP